MMVKHVPLYPERFKCDRRRYGNRPNDRLYSTGGGWGGEAALVAELEGTARVYGGVERVCTGVKLSTDVDRAVVSAFIVALLSDRCNGFASQKNI